MSIGNSRYLISLKGFWRGLERKYREMVDQYKGYEIRVFWSDIEKGYVFCVFSMDGEGIMESDPYFYEENALIGARETIDRIITKNGK